MLIFSFICSIIFSIVFITFIVASIIVIVRQRKIEKEFKEEINGFETFDLKEIYEEEKNKKE